MTMRGSLDSTFMWADPRLELRLGGQRGHAELGEVGGERVHRDIDPLRPLALLAQLQEIGDTVNRPGDLRTAVHAVDNVPPGLGKVEVVEELVVLRFGNLQREDVQPAAPCRCETRTQATLPCSSDSARPICPTRNAWPRGL